MPVPAPIPDLSAAVGAQDERGIVPHELDPPTARALGAAFADVVVVGTDPTAGTGAADRSQVVVGHDLRSSGADLAAAFAAGLTSRGVDAVLLGPCSSDGLAFASGSMEVPGALFTASHDPREFDGLRLCRTGARPVGRDSGLATVRELAQTYLADGVPAVDAAARGEVTQRQTMGAYAEFLRSLVDLTGIRALTVVVDAGTGIGSRTVPAVLDAGAGLPALPLELVLLAPGNLADLRAAVVAREADLGIAFDDDATRCVVVDERGDVVSPSVIAALVGLREVERDRADGNRPTVLHDPLGSQAVPDLLAAAGATLVRTQVGRSTIAEQMAEHGAVFGGERGGHYYFRDLYFAGSGLLAALHVLAALGGQPGALSELAELFQPYSTSGELGSRVDDVAAACERVVQAYVREQGAGPVRVDELDGLTVRHWDTTPRWWFTLQASTTEPLLALVVEAADDDVMEKVRDDVLALVRAGVAAHPKESR